MPSFVELFAKHDTGAQLIGAPSEFLSNPPPDIVLTRGKDEFLTDPTGKTVEANTYLDFWFRLNGLVTQTSVIEARTWLIGVPLIRLYVNTIDVRNTKDPLLMTPLP
jgi:hypothetical protein